MPLPSEPAGAARRKTKREEKSKKKRAEGGGGEGDEGEEEADTDNDTDTDDDEDDDDAKEKDDEKHMIGQNVGANKNQGSAKMSVRNLRIREDTAKHRSTRQVARLGCARARLPRLPRAPLAALGGWIPAWGEGRAIGRPATASDARASRPAKPPISPPRTSRAGTCSTSTSTPPSTTPRRARCATTRSSAPTTPTTTR